MLMRRNPQRMYVCGDVLVLAGHVSLNTPSCVKDFVRFCCSVLGFLVMGDAVDLFRNGKTVSGIWILIGLIINSVSHYRLMWLRFNDYLPLHSWCTTLTCTVCMCVRVYVRGCSSTGYIVRASLDTALAKWRRFWGVATFCLVFTSSDSRNWRLRLGFKIRIRLEFGALMRILSVYTV